MRLLLCLAFLSSCACPYDNHIVNPVQWHEVEFTDLKTMCPEAGRGCVISKHDGDHIYTLPVLKP